MSAVTVLEQLEDGDRVLYNEKKSPLTVESVEDEEVTVQGPKGGEYLLFIADDDPELVLESQSGNKQYSSRVDDLRVVGQWEQTGDDQWRHTRTGAEVSLVETGAGYWTVEITGFEGEGPDVPKYGFTAKTHAREAAETFMEDYPEGKDPGAR